MFSKKLAALVTGALLVAASSVAVQAAPLTRAALMQSGGEEGTGMNTAAVIGVSFALISAGILIADSGNKDGAPVSP